MLSPHDRALIERDAALPGFATLLSLPALRSAARAQGIPIEIPDARPVYLRYKPATSCLAGYAASGENEPTLFYATAFTAGSEKLRKARKRRRATWLPGGGRFVLDRQAIELSFFPNDDHLSALIDLVDPLAGREYLARVAADAWNVGETLDAFNVRVLAYKPERRCTILIRDARSAFGVLKAYTPAGFALAAVSASALRDAEGDFQRMRWADAHRNLLAFDWLDGRTLSEAILHGRATELDTRAAGTALAKLHLTRAQSLPTRNPDRRAVLDSLASTLTRLSAESATTAKLVASRAGAFVLQDDSRLVVTHGDFYSKQVLLQDGAASLIDLDEAAMGHAAYDIGNFIAHLELDVAHDTVSREAADMHTESFRAGYAAVRELPSASAIAGHLAASLLALAHDPFRRHDKEWPRITSLILSRAAEIIDGGARRPARVSSRSSGFHLDEALSPSSARAALDGRVELDEGCARVSAVHAARLIRIKAQRRCVIEYDVTLESGREKKTETLVGKSRWRGLDHSTYATLLALRSAGFTETSSDGIAVPAPRGKVERFNMWLSSKARGQPLTQFIFSPSNESLATLVANTAYKLNTSGIAPSRSHTMADELDVLADKLSIVRRRLPAIASRIDAVEQACRDLSVNVVPDEYVPIHRDFYSDQLLIDQDRIWMLDIDLVALGDPALDIGNFLGHVTELGLRAAGDADAGSMFEDALKERVLELYGSAFIDRAEVFRTLTLARHLWISTEKPDRVAFTEPLLELCESRLSSPSIHRPSGVVL